MTESDYVVIRPAANLPDGFMPSDLDGKWFDRSMLGRPGTGWIPDGFAGAVAVPSGRFEYRKDGAVAEVWEMRP